MGGAGPKQSHGSMHVGIIAMLSQVEGVDASTLTSGVTAVTLLGLVLACIKIALGQADKRATEAREREKICTEALTGSVAANTALAAEVRTNHTELRDGLRDILDHVRRSSKP